MRAESVAGFYHLFFSCYSQLAGTPGRHPGFTFSSRRRQGLFSFRTAIQMDPFTSRHLCWVVRPIVLPLPIFLSPPFRLTFRPVRLLSVLWRKIYTAIAAPNPGQPPCQIRWNSKFKHNLGSLTPFDIIYYNVSEPNYCQLQAVKWAQF